MPDDADITGGLPDAPQEDESITDVPPGGTEPEQPAPEGVVVFDVEKFRGFYPEFEPMTDAQLEGLFDRACLCLDNTPASIVRDLKKRETLLFMLVCHLATLSMRGGAGGGGAVGAVASATEGSVSVSFAPMTGYNAQSQWYAQTPCGAAYWQAVKPYIYGGRTYVQRTH